MDSIEESWKLMNNNHYIQLICAQEVGEMLKGGNWVLAKRLMDATPAFHWVRTGSFLCGVRESGPWCIESCNKVKAGLSSKMNGRYMQHVTIQNKVIHSAV